MPTAGGLDEAGGGLMDRSPFESGDVAEKGRPQGRATRGPCQRGGVGAMDVGTIWLRGDEARNGESKAINE